MAHDSSPWEENDAVALVRVYCGLASADESVRSGAAWSPLSIAVVDDAGRLLAVHEISDDPAGYARLGAFLVERTSGFTEAAIAADSDDHLVTSLLAAAGRPIVVADDDLVDDFAERFADDESAAERRAGPAARRAVGLARALQAGALAALINATPRELVTYKPVLAAHLAMLTGRQAAATALREVLRELYPAALRAYPDPARHLPMAVLELLPEPGRLTGGTARSHDADEVAGAVVTELQRAGAGDADSISSAVTALHVAIDESPRRGGVNKSLAPAVADTVRQAIAAVRSCDAACEALVSTLAARVTQPPAATAAGRASSGRASSDSNPSVDPSSGSTSSPNGTAGRRGAGRRSGVPEPALGLQSVPPLTEPAPTRIGRRSRQEPAAGSSPATPRPITAPPVAPHPMTPPPSAPRPVSPRPTAPPPAAPAAAADLPGRNPGQPANRPVSVPPPPPGMTPIVPGSRNPVPPAESGQPFRPTLTNAAINNARAERQRTVIPPRPNTRAQGGPPSPSTPGFGAADYSLPMPTPRPGQDAPAAHAPAPEPGSRANWPLSAPRADDRPAASRANDRPAPSRANDRPAPSHDRPAPFHDRSAPSRGDDRPAPLRADDRPASFRGDDRPAPFRGDDRPAPLRGDDRPAPFRGDDRPAPVPAAGPPAGRSASDGRVRPPWQADDLPAEPPSLRLVEPQLGDRPLGGAGDLPDPGESRPLRLVDRDLPGRNGRNARRTTLTALDRSATPPVPDEGDGDLLIFAAARSAWFTGQDSGEVDREWATQADTGWRAAEKAAHPEVAAETSAGLPKRVPQANLVPGSPQREERPLRIVRDAASIAAHTTGYFRGWRRGQEIGGYAVGGRPGRESAGGWDFTRDGGSHNDDYGTNAGFRSS